MKTFKQFEQELNEKLLFGEALLKSAPVEEEKEEIELAEGDIVRISEGEYGTVVATNDEFVLYESADGVIGKTELVNVQEKIDPFDAFFKAALKKFGVKDPADLDKKKRKEFFNYVDKNWKADNEK